MFPAGGRYLQATIEPLCRHHRFTSDPMLAYDLLDVTEPLNVAINPSCLTTGTLVLDHYKACKKMLFTQTPVTLTYHEDRLNRFDLNAGSDSHSQRPTLSGTNPL